MKIYDYKCKKCDEIFEAFVDEADKDLAKCPKCNKKLIRLMSFPKLIKVN